MLEPLLKQIERGVAKVNHEPLVIFYPALSFPCPGNGVKSLQQDSAGAWVNAFFGMRDEEI